MDYDFPELKPRRWASKSGSPKAMNEFAVNRKGDVLLLAATKLAEQPTRAQIKDSTLMLYAGDKPIHLADEVPADLVSRAGVAPSLYVVECPENTVTRESKVPLSI
jgi:hypothetical protein